MTKTIQVTLQRLLLTLGVLALIFLLVEIGISLAAAQPKAVPARVDQVTVGAYHFTVRLYDDPARAGFALPFAIAPQGATGGSWQYQVTSVPVGTVLPNGRIVMDGGRIATVVRDSVSPDPHASGGVQGAAEITVQGQWNLHVIVTGSAGRQIFDVPIIATTLPAIPAWFAWALGFLPIYIAAVFFFVRSSMQNNKRSAVQAERKLR